MGKLQEDRCCTVRKGWKHQEEKEGGRERWGQLHFKWITKQNLLALKIVNKRNCINIVSDFKAPKRQPRISHLPWQDQRNRVNLFLCLYIKSRALLPRGRFFQS